MFIWLWTNSERGAEFLFNAYIGPAFEMIRGVADGVVVSFEDAVGLSKYKID